jgi:hypothetical protein
VKEREKRTDIGKCGPGNKGVGIISSHRTIKKEKKNKRRSGRGRGGRKEWIGNPLHFPCTSPTLPLCVLLTHGFIKDIEETLDEFMTFKLNKED